MSYHYLIEYAFVCKEILFLFHAENQENEVEEVPYENLRIVNRRPSSGETKKPISILQLPYQENSSTAEELYVTMSASPTSPIPRKSLIPIPNSLDPVSEEINPGNEQLYVTMISSPTKAPTRTGQRKSLPVVNTTRSSNQYGIQTVEEEAAYVSMFASPTTRRAHSLVPGANNNPYSLQPSDESSYVAMDATVKEPRGRRSLVPQNDDIYLPRMNEEMGTEATYVNAADLHQAHNIARKSSVPQVCSQYSSDNNRVPKAEETYMSMTSLQTQSQSATASSTNVRQQAAELNNSIYAEVGETMQNNQIEPESTHEYSLSNNEVSSNNDTYKHR